MRFKAVLLLLVLLLAGCVHTTPTPSYGDPTDLVWRAERVRVIWWDMKRNPTYRNEPWDKPRWFNMDELTPEDARAIIQDAVDLGWKE